MSENAWKIRRGVASLCLGPGKGWLKMDPSDVGICEGFDIETRGGYVRLRSHAVPRKRITLSRAIMQPLPEMVVDHINHNPLDNRRANLRICTRSENARNNRGHRGRKSPYKGVCFDRCSRLPGRMWKAYTRVSGKQISLGYHATAEAAALAYDDYAREQFGEFALLNEV